MGLPLHARVEKTVHEVETHWLSDRGKVLGTADNKEGHAVTVFWNMKGPIIIDFLEKDTIENSTSYCLGKISLIYWMTLTFITAQSAGAVEYADCISNGEAPVLEFWGMWSTPLIAINSR